MNYKNQLHNAANTNVFISSLLKPFETTKHTEDTEYVFISTNLIWKEENVVGSKFECKIFFLRTLNTS